MPLTLRPAGLSSPAYRDWLDYVIVEDGRDVGRLYEDRHSKPELRWFWSITVYVNPRLGIITSGRAASLDEAKAQFLTNWQRCRADSTPSAQRFYLACRHVVCVRVSCRRALSRRASPQPPRTHLAASRGFTKSSAMGSGSLRARMAIGLSSTAVLATI